MKCKLEEQSALGQGPVPNCHDGQSASEWELKGQSTTAGCQGGLASRAGGHESRAGGQNQFSHHQLQGGGIDLASGSLNSAGLQAKSGFGRNYSRGRFTLSVHCRPVKHRALEKRCDHFAAREVLVLLSVSRCVDSKL